MLGRVGQRLLHDAVEGQPGRGGHGAEVAVHAQIDRQSRAPEVLHQGRYIACAGKGLRRHLAVAVAPRAQQADSAADVGQALAPQPLGLGQRDDRFVGIVLHRQPGGGDVEHGDGEGVGDDVVDLTGDALPLLVGRLLRQSRLRLPQLGYEGLLAPPEPSCKPSEPAAQAPRYPAVSVVRGGHDGVRHQARHAHCESRQALSERAQPSHPGTKADDGEDRQAVVVAAHDDERSGGSDAGVHEPGEVDAEPVEHIGQGQDRQGR